MSAERGEANDETVTVVFYVEENNTLVLAVEAEKVYKRSHHQRKMSAQLGYAVSTYFHQGSGGEKKFFLNN